MNHNYQKDISGCGLSGLISRSKERIPGDVIIKSICPMRDRGNGLGAGFAAYGIYPDYSDYYAFHIMYDHGTAKDLAESFIELNYEIAKQERIPHKRTDNIIIASDRDISQLCNYAKMYDLFKTEITIETTYRQDKVETLIEDTEDVPTFLLYKALKGDNSDKINGFRPRTGPKTAAKFINNKDELKEICNNDKESFQRLKNNLKIMDFKRMPERIKNDIWKEWEKINESS